LGSGTPSDTKALQVMTGRAQNISRGIDGSMLPLGTLAN
jgi:hypothetical protein